MRKVNIPARVTAIATASGQVRVNAGGLWDKIVLTGEHVTLAFIDTSAKTERPDGALTDGRIATGTRDIARAWFAEPTSRYDHGILGDKIEAGALVIEGRDGKRQTLRLKDDAVFEDLEPRLVDLDGNGQDDIVVVKSYLKRGSCVAVIGPRRGRYETIAETPPLGAPHRWLDPAGIADFTGDGKIDIALVRQPHVVGMLELWSWENGGLRKVSELPDVTNHIAGTRAISMTAVADFDGDGIADIAAPPLDRSRLRIISFAPGARDIAS
ncbi:MAG: FG-GAP repeat domain-containing protein, partial [Candidatus Binataceae bacterium]